MTTVSVICIRNYGIVSGMGYIFSSLNSEVLFPMWQGAVTLILTWINCGWDTKRLILPSDVLGH